MTNTTITSIHKLDVHALYIWGAGGHPTQENTISIQVHTTETLVTNEADLIWVDTADVNSLLNIRSTNIEFLKTYVEDKFPHLYDLGNPMAEGVYSDDWIVYADRHGVDVINDDDTSDTIINWTEGMEA